MCITSELYLDKINSNQCECEQKRKTLDLNFDVGVILGGSWLLHYLKFSQMSGY